MIFYVNEEKEVIIKPVAGAIDGASDGARAVA